MKGQKSILNGARGTLYAGAAVVALFAPHAAAQDGGALSEIVVSATKRPQSLQDVPLSISAVDGETLQDAGIQKLEELSAQIPNLSISATPIGDTIAIRGINSDAQGVTDQSIGIFVDGVFRGRSIQSRFAFLDPALVEVLRGPQSTIFGKNTSAGAIVITSARPTADFSAFGSASYEFEHEESELRAYVSGPVSERLRLRLAGQLNDMDQGWTENAANGQTVPQYTNYGVRLSGEYDLSDAIDVFAKVEHADFDVDGQPFEVATITRPGAAALLGALGVDPDLNGRTFIRNSVAAPPGLGDKSYLMEGDSDEALFRLDWDVGAGDVTALIAHSRYEFTRTLDADNGPLDLIGLVEPEEFEQNSVELRYASDLQGPFNYLAGIYWQDSNLKNQGGYTLANFGGLGGSLTGLPAVQRNGFFDQDAETWAAFGQVIWDVTDTVRLTGGLRYSDESKSAVQSVDLSDLGGGTVPGGTGAYADPAVVEATYRVLLETNPHTTRPSRSEEATDWSVNLQWTPRPDAMLYATAAQGSKSGGFNPNYFAYGVADPAAWAEEIQYEPEEARSYELGAKLRFGGALELNTALFLTQFKDLQTSIFTGNTGFIVQNAAEAESRGVEVDARWAVNDRFDLHGSVAWLDFEFTDYVNAGCTAAQIYGPGGTGSPATCAAAGTNDLSGRTNQDAPEITAAIGGEYRIPFGAHVLRLGADVLYVDEYYAAADLDPATVQDAYTKVNALAAFGPDSGAWEIALVGRNLTDELTYRDANDLPPSSAFWGAHRVTLERPRTIALRVSARM